jgi:HSP20 family protein
MELKKLAPWNWFKKEEEIAHTVPVRHGEKEKAYLPERQYEPVMQLHREIDHLFDHFFRGFALPALGSAKSFLPFDESVLFKPQVDLSASDKEYLLTVEIPGVNENDVSVDVSGNTMTIRGKKNRKKRKKRRITTGSSVGMVLFNASCPCRRMSTRTASRPTSKTVSFP